MKRTRWIRKTAMMLALFCAVGSCLLQAASASDEKKSASADQVLLKGLVRDLKDPDSQVRRDAAVSILRLGPPAKEAIPALLEAMKDKDPIVRQNSVDAVAEIAVAAPGVLPALVQSLKDEEYLVRTKSAGALGVFGPDAREALPQLLKAAHDEKKIVRAFVMEALGKIGPAEKVVPALVEGLKDSEEIVRLRAADALAVCQTPQAQQALEQYRKENRHKR